MMSLAEQSEEGTPPLHVRITQLALARKWLSRSEFIEIHHEIASDNDEAWIQHVRTVRDLLLAHLPSLPSGRILELGCSSGDMTAYLSTHYPTHPLIAVESSEHMLHSSREQLQGKPIEWVQMEPPEYVFSQPANSAALIISVWTIGYARPYQIIQEAGRILVPGGILAFVTNYADMLRPIVRTFQDCMTQFPDKVTLAYVPQFPKNWAQLEKRVRRSKFTVEWQQEGKTPIITPKKEKEKKAAPLSPPPGNIIEWDQIAEYSKIAAYFEQQIATRPEPLVHHYVSVIAKRV
jgi:SAM-dependent methyltransferase